MSIAKTWLDFSRYNLKLVLARDLSGNSRHTLVFAGAGLAQEGTLKSLSQLGFSKDVNFPARNYWSRSIVDFRLTDLKAIFPLAEVVSLPVEEISPALKKKIQKRASAGANNGTSSERPRERDTGIATRPERRSVDVARDGQVGVLGATGARADVRTKPTVDGSSVQEQPTARVSERSAGALERSSPRVGNSVSQTESSQPRSVASGADRLAESGEVVRQGNAVDPVEPENVLSDAGVDLTTAAQLTQVPVATNIVSAQTEASIQDVSPELALTDAGRVVAEKLVRDARLALGASLRWTNDDLEFNQAKDKARFDQALGEASEAGNVEAIVFFNASAAFRQRFDELAHFASLSSDEERANQRDEVVRLTQQLRELSDKAYASLGTVVPGADVAEVASSDQVGDSVIAVTAEQASSTLGVAVTDPVKVKTEAPASISGGSTSEGFDAAEYELARRAYANGLEPAAGDEEPLDAPFKEMNARRSDSLALDAATFSEVREAFNQREYDTAYELYQNGVNGNGLEREAFETVFAGLSGDKVADGKLSLNQRRELHRMGLKDNVIEHFASFYTGTGESLAYVFDFATQNDALVAASITQRMTGETGLGGTLSRHGFTYDIDLETPDGTPSYLFTHSSGEAISVGLEERALFIAGHDDSDESTPVFKIVDNFSSSPTELAQRLGEILSEHWPHLNAVVAAIEENHDAPAPNQLAVTDQAEPTEIEAQAADPLHADIVEPSEQPAQAVAAPSAAQVLAPVAQPVSLATSDQDLLHLMRAAVATAESQPEFPAGWLVMNAPRPILGHELKDGNFLDGRFYAAIDLSDSLAPLYIKENNNLKATVVVTATEREQALMAIDGNRHRLRYLENIETAEGRKILQPLIRNMQQRTYEELGMLLTKVQALPEAELSAAPAAESTIVDELGQAEQLFADAVAPESDLVGGAASGEAVFEDFEEASQTVIEEVFATNRQWQGATRTHMRDSQRLKVNIEDVFKVLAQVESGAQLNDLSKRMLTSFKGWGVAGDTLRVDHQSRQDYKNLKGLTIAKTLGMAPGDFQRTYWENRLESYYTPPQIAESIWKAVEIAGVKPGGKYLDAGCGSAAFFVTAPDKVQAHATLIGVECDPIASRIAKALAPDATILTQKYEQALLAKDFDAVVGNVPFGSSKIHDSNYPDAHHIHDYFILRSLDQLKPGGISAFITSAGSLDKADPKVRQEMMARADLVGAIRLPREAFSHLNANVDTDIIFLQRRPEGTRASFDYTESVSASLNPATQHMFADSKGEFRINRYFLDHPDNLLGTYVSEMGPHGLVAALRNPEMTRSTVEDRFDKMQLQIDGRVERFMPRGLALKKHWVPATAQKTVDGAPAVEVEFKLEDEQEDWSKLDRIEQQIGNFVGDNFLADDGRILEIIDIAPKFDDEGLHVGYEHLIAETGFAGKKRDTMVAYIHLRDACRDLINMQLHGSDTELADSQQNTNALYEAFTKRFGAVNSRSVVRIIGDDAGSAEVCALEIWDDEHDKVLALADTFTRRVIGAEREYKIETAEDAYYHSIDTKGGIDFEFMASVTGLEVDNLKQHLVGTLVFFNPGNESYEPQHKYLSGNVVRKLAQAELAAASMPELQVNVEKLLKAQPDPIPFEDISLRLGVGWIPPSDVEAFVSEMFGRNLAQRDLSISYTAEIGSWAVTVSNGFKAEFETRRTTINGTTDHPFERALEYQLNGQRPSHYDKTAEGKQVLNDERTMASRLKQEEIESGFKSWVGRSEERILRYTELYNTNCNNIALPIVDGSRITLPGLASSWSPRKHQLDAVAMSLMGENMMAAHCVGAGKTFEMVAMAIKAKQVGLANKPAIAVPNHMLGQITREAKQMFPAAKILQVTADDLRGRARQRFLARVRNNDWDLVVFTHSMMNQIQAPLKIQTKEMLKSVYQIEAKIEDADGRIKRQLEASLKSMVSQIDNAKKEFEDQNRKGGVLTIDRLGIDLLNVDETHLYKNLAINSNMNVLGVTRGGSKRAQNFKMLAEYMRDLHGRSYGVNAFTGTVVSNTICELYVHGSILRPELFEEQGIYDFDEWAKRFGDVVSALEPLPEGGGFRVNERFARFVNLPEMIKLFRTFADVKNASDLNLPVPDVEQNIVSVDQTPFQKDFMKHLAIRATKVRTGQVQPHEDNMLAVATAGRKAALDLRLVSPLIPDEASLKLIEVARNVHNEWEMHGNVKAAQIVFMDMGTPKKDGTFTTYQKLRDLLVATGIPDKDIAFVHEAKNDAEKEALFEKVRKGDIRVIIGSTEKMGVGTNVQERLCAMHDVDCPWRPSDIAQRRGRIERQGNKFFSEVRNYRYTTKDSFDLFMWGANQRKANFIAQALGDPTKVGREVSEEIDLGYAEVMAVTTGNPKIREKVETDDQVNKMERKRKVFNSDLYARASEARHLKSEIASLHKRLESEQKIALALPRAPAGEKPVEISGAALKANTDAHATLLRATDVGEVLLQRIPVVQARLIQKGEDYERLGMKIGKIDLVVQLSVLHENDIFNRHQEPIIRGMVDGEFTALRIGVSKSSQAMGQMVREFYDTSMRTKKIEHELKQREASYELVKDITLSSEWPQEAEFKELVMKQRELNQWFAKQDFNKNDGHDPFLARMSALERAREEEVRLATLDVEIAANGDQEALLAGFGGRDQTLEEEDQRTTMRFG